MNTNEKTEVTEITKENAELFLSDEKYFKNGHLDLSGLTCLERICDEAFKEKNIESVEFPTSLEYIGGWAFENNKLKEVDLSDTRVMAISVEVFKNNQIDYVDFSECLEWVGSWSFKNNQLKWLDLSDTQIDIIGEGAFENNKLRKVKFPASLKTIGDKAFLNNQLKKIDFRNTQLEAIHSKAFADNCQLEDVRMPKRVSKHGIRLWRDAYKGSDMHERVELYVASMCDRYGIDLYDIDNR